MGHSPSIQDLRKKENAFRAYLDSLEKEITGKLATRLSAMDQEIDSYYSKNGWTKNIIVSGQSSDFMQKSEWSLENLGKVIGNIGNVMFGGTQPLPKGVKVESVPQAISKVSNLELLFTAKAFEVISGIMSTIGGSTTVGLQTEQKGEVLGAGIHLWVTAALESYKDSSYFSGNEILQYLFAYKVTWSEGEANKERQMTQALANANTEFAYEAIINMADKELNSLATQMGSGKLDPVEFEAKSKAFNEIIKDFKAKEALLNS